MALGWRREYLRYKNYFLNVLATYRKRKDLRMFLEIILSISTVSLFVALALKPTVLTIAELMKEIRTKEETLAKMDEKIQNLDRAQTLYAQNETKILLLKDAIPITPAPDSLVRQIEGVATRHPITILGMSMGEATLVGKEKALRRAEELEALPEGARGLTFSISTAGGYQDIAAFLSTLESLRRPVKIDAANINSSETDEGEIIVLVVTGRAPYLKEAALKD